jgi:hypothetical protein
VIYGSLLFLQLQSSNIGDVHKTELWVQQNPAFGEKTLLLQISQASGALYGSQWNGIGNLYNVHVKISIYIYMYVCLKLMGGLSQLAGLIAVAPPCGAMAEASHGRL